MIGWLSISHADGGMFDPAKFVDAALEWAGCGYDRLAARA